MKQTERGGRSSLFWAVWGICAALAITLFDWLRTRQLDSPLEVAGRLVIFVAVGVFIGPFVSRRIRSRGDRKPTRVASISRFALLVALMLALAYVLWIMAKA